VPAANRGTPLASSRLATRDSQPGGGTGAGRPGGAAGPRGTGDWAAAGGAGWEDVEGDAVGAGEGLSCFVEARFRGMVRRTVAVDSDSPIWNEQVGRRAGEARLLLSRAVAPAKGRVPAVLAKLLSPGNDRSQLPALLRIIQDALHL
jgi:hypothetical protein